jgi:hypothetical protein
MSRLMSVPSVAKVGWECRILQDSGGIYKNELGQQETAVNKLVSEQPRNLRIFYSNLEPWTRH